MLPPPQQEPPLLSSLRTSVHSSFLWVPTLVPQTSAPALASSAAAVNASDPGEFTPSSSPILKSYM